MSDPQGLPHPAHEAWRRPRASDPDQRGQVGFVIGLLAAGAALLGKAIRDMRHSEREDRSAARSRADRSGLLELSPRGPRLGRVTPGRPPPP